MVTRRVQPIEHDIYVCFAGAASGIATRLAPRLSAGFNVIISSSLSDAAHHLTASAARQTFDLLPPALDDEVRNYKPGDLYLKVRPQPCDVILARVRPPCLAIVVVESAGTDAELNAFLQQIQGLGIQRVLLTNAQQVADSIELLNREAADSIVIADRDDTDATLVLQLERLKLRYFEKTQGPLRQALIANGVGFLDDSVAEALVADAKHKLGANRHCVLADPPGVLIANAAGEQAFVLLCGDEYVRAQAEIAESRDALALPPSGFAEAGTAEAWAAVVAASGSMAAPSALRSTVITRDFATEAIFDQIVTRRGVAAPS